MASELSDEDSRATDPLNQALDNLIKRLTQEGGNIFFSEEERTGAVHRSSKKRRILWSKKRICMFPGCTQKTLNSHTLQRGGPLATIAENSHVLTPRHGVPPQGMFMDEVGIGVASTFSGFCGTHELLFAPFEQSGELEENSHVALQIFRSICREIVRVEWHLRDAEAALEEFDQQVFKLGSALVASELTDGGYSPDTVTITDIQTTTPRRTAAEKELSRFKILDQELKEIFFKPSIADIKDAPAGGLAYFCVTIEETFPLCLAGMGNFHIKENDQFIKVNVILNVWPSDTKTKIIIAGSAEHDDAIKNYFALQANQFLGVLTMLETWMINGTDHWFITPSIWEKIPEHRRSTILNDILDDRYSIAMMYPRSIFDDIRAAALAGDITDKPIEEVERERRKLMPEQ